MKVLIDTNVILDVLCDRKEFVHSSLQVWKNCEIGAVEGCVSAMSIPNIIYILRKELSQSQVREIIQQLGLIFTFSDLKADDLLKAAGSDFHDYEDALQEVCALRVGAQYIVTRNIRDFQNSKIPAIKPEELLERL